MIVVVKHRNAAGGGIVNAESIAAAAGLNRERTQIATLEQEFAKDNKQTIKGILGNAVISRFAQVEIGH